MKSSILLTNICILLLFVNSCQDSTQKNDPENTQKITSTDSRILAKLSGTKDGDHTSSIFLLNKPAILRYKYQPKMFDTGGFTVCLMPEDSHIDTDGCLPEVMAMYGEESEVLIDKPKGKYYLLVSAINAEWEIVLEEKAN